MMAVVVYADVVLMAVVAKIYFFIEFYQIAQGVNVTEMIIEEL
jgi:hypothetical protein